MCACVWVCVCVQMFVRDKGKESEMEKEREGARDIFATYKHVSIHFIQERPVALPNDQTQLEPCVSQTARHLYAICVRHFMKPNYPVMLKYHI